MGKLLDLFNPLKWWEKAVSIVTFVAVVFGLVWWGWSSLGNHFTEKQEAEYKRVEQVAMANKLQREALNDANAKKAKDEKIKQLEVLAADAVRLRAANDRMSNNLRASATTESDLSACVQRARALDQVQQAVRGFADRVVQAADRHVADKVACTAAWPKN